ncbi:MAG: RraA family protein [Actinomycetota bacterium]|nr:RraA family protein [Actinomycetota bacterium]
MPILINPAAPELPTSLVEEAGSVDVPTLGHFLEEGFCDPAIARQVGRGRLVGRAVTVRITATDSTLVHKATGLLQPGDVLVVDTGGDRIHAPVGGVVANAVAAAGAVGVVIDGVCTDKTMLAETGLVVYARGTSVLTTKLIGLDAGGINVPVSCGGVPVRPGALVLGDDNGVLIGDPTQVAGALGQARESDDSEPALLEKIRSGQKLSELSAADALLAKLGHEA